MNIFVRRAAWGWTWFLFVAFLVQLPMVLNPGYFSHDELEWLALGDSAWGDLAWPSWTDIHVFQYRPLTFSLWLMLSHFFGAVPPLMHLLHVSLGILNAALLRLAMLRYGARHQDAFGTALVFLLLPFSAYTQGWIGTYADMLCLFFLLLAILWVGREPAGEKTRSRLAIDIAVIASLTTLALLSKESAIVFPCLIAAAVVRIKPRDLLPAVAASTVVVGIYLALRVDTILFAPRPPGAYTWNFANIPARLYEYALFAFMPRTFEVFTIHQETHVPWLALLAFCAVLLATASAGWRWGVALVIGWCAALGPVLILGYSANMYAYLACAFACAVFALAYPRIAGYRKLALLIPCAVALVHGANVMREIRHIGVIQQHLYADLSTLLPGASHEQPLRLQAATARYEWVLSRLTYEIASYRGLPLAERIIVLDYADTDAQPTHVMLRDGHLSTVRK